MLKFKSLLVVLISLAFVATACEKKQEASADEPEAAAEKEAPQEVVDQEEAAEEKADKEELAMVDVPKEGKAFEPAVESEQIPAGAWYCDMGTVHWASMEKGDGSCAECGMKLKQKAVEEAAGEQAAGEKAEADDHAGHDHK